MATPTPPPAKPGPLTRRIQEAKQAQAPKPEPERWLPVWRRQDLSRDETGRVVGR